jgi:CubicO group peptidase (beta-lactamase class C family)
VALRAASLAIVVALVPAACGGGGRVPARSAAHDQWLLAAPAAEGLDRAALARIDRRIAGTFSGVDSFLVARHGRLVYERYYRGVERDDLLSIESITKPVVSALIGIALGEGKLRRIDERLEEIFPEAFGPRIDPRARRLTLRHLLTMTGGFCCHVVIAPADPVHELIARPIYAEPGTVFRYDNALSDLLSALLTRAVEMPAARYAETRLFGPLGMAEPIWGSDDAGNSSGDGGLRLRPRDLLAFGQLYLGGGRWRGRQLVPAAWVRASTRAQVRITPRLGFGFDWWIPRGPPPSFAGYGSGGQEVVVFPSLDLVLVVTSTAEDPRVRQTIAKLVTEAVMKT